MIYRFTIISDEVDDFVREIQIDPEATFFDFHEAILKSVGYANDQMTSFFICDDDWEKEKEVTLEEMDDNPEIDSWVMKETPISELIEDEKQKLLYVFDYMTELVHQYIGTNNSVIINHDFTCHFGRVPNDTSVTNQRIVCHVYTFH